MYIKDYIFIKKKKNIIHMVIMMRHIEIILTYKIRDITHETCKIQDISNYKTNEMFDNQKKTLVIV